MTNATGETKGRVAFLDFLRILAAFFVIVNHTNSGVFLERTPAELQWHLSLLWYYTSKTAVPIFMMISGACLLGKRDSYGKIGRRILRTVLALVLDADPWFVSLAIQAESFLKCPICLWRIRSRKWIHDVTLPEGRENG